MAERHGRAATSSPWQTSVDELVRIFRDSLVAVAPVLTRAYISHAETEAYDDWDEIAQVLFTNIVVRSLQWSPEAGPSVNVPRYAHRYADYDELSTICVRSAARSVIFHSFVTSTELFDSVRCIEAESKTDDGMAGILVPLQEVAEFSFQLLEKPGVRRTIRQLAVGL